MAALLLIHSPFLGPASWRPVAQRLTGRGVPVVVPSLAAVAYSDPPYWPAGVDAVVAAADAEPVVLVVHSNAGLYVPALVERLGDRVVGVLYVDAALPGTGHRTPPDFLTRIVDDDGLLPPWTSWWDEGLVASLFPDAATQAEVEAEQPRMPLAYYDNLPPGAVDLALPPSAFVWFGAPYDEGAAEALRRGWPTVHVPGQHLHMLVDPDAVAATLLELAETVVAR